MTIWICATCGIGHPDTGAPPSSCAICLDERQYVPATGQRWTHQRELSADGHRMRIEPLEPGLHGLSVVPRFAIGQRGLLVCTPAGNLLWEPPGYLDEETLAAVEALGGVAAISASHPHLTGACIQWSHAFDRAPVWVASADRAWIRRPDPVIELWAGVHEVLPGLTMIQCGGHFAGSAVVHWDAGAGGKGAMLSGDTIQIGADRASVSAMRSYPNNIPLPAPSIRRILEATAVYDYDRLYSAFAVIEQGAKPLVEASLSRYMEWIQGHVPDEPER
ncbi:hydrolase [Arthrobacter sp. 179]|uniref:hydrolase n=1 Tax=Arthrobacter sp. 179 TaxID=3457734 RepID=UPI0040340F89